MYLQVLLSQRCKITSCLTLPEASAFPPGSTPATKTKPRPSPPLATSSSCRPSDGSRSTWTFTTSICSCIASCDRQTREFERVSRQASDFTRLKRDPVCDQLGSRVIERTREIEIGSVSPILFVLTSPPATDAWVQQLHAPSDTAVYGRALCTEIPRYCMRCCAAVVQPKYKF